MPNTGDSFITTLQQAHLEWGSHRYTSTRNIIYGEGYLQISADIAYGLGITNNNLAAGNSEYDFNTSDGFITDGKLLASGNQSNPQYAKQFQGSGDLKLLGDWFHHINAQIGDRIQVDFISPTRILLTKI